MQHAGEKFVSYAEGKCNRQKNMFMPFCCNEKVPDKTCYWQQKADVEDIEGPCDNVHRCGSGHVKIGVYAYGENQQCNFDVASIGTEAVVPIERPRAFCCNAKAAGAVRRITWKRLLWWLPILTLS